MNSTEFTTNSLAEASGNPKPQSVDRVIKDNIMADQSPRDGQQNVLQSNKSSALLEVGTMIGR
jgi:hypothetical protein